MILEAVVIDPLYWKAGKSDKPVSTWIRGLMYASLAVIMDYGMGYNWWYMNIILGIALNFMVFGYLVNFMRNKSWDYLSDSGFDKYFKKIPAYLRLFLQAWILISAMLVYYYVKGDIYQQYSFWIDIPIYNR